MQNKNIKTLKELAKKGGLATFLILGLNACNDNSNQNNQGSGTFTNASQQEGAFVVVEKASDGSYKIADEFPAAKTTIVLRNPDGTERILSQEEIDKLVFALYYDFFCLIPKQNIKKAIKKYKLVSKK